MREQIASASSSKIVLQSPLRAQSVAVGGVSSCLSSLYGVGMSLGRHVGERESQESHEEVSSPPKNQELESPE